jgi:hypothetical protein
MRESRTSGSVRGARDNPRPYRYRVSAGTKKHHEVGRSGSPAKGRS